MADEPRQPDADTTAAWAPTVSVVVATHNRPELLRIAVDAILRQDYTGPIDLVIVFDRSEPDLGLESDTDRQRRVRVITNDRSPGLAGARNSGIMATTGELVAFCDDDDEWLPGKISAQVRSLTGSPALTSVTGIRIVYADHETVRTVAAESLTLADLVRRRVMEAHPSTVLVRRDALIGPIGLVDEQIPGSYAEDFDWILRAARAGTIAAVESDLVRVRWGQSLFSRNWQVIIDAIDYLIDKHPELRNSREGLARLMGRRAFALAALGQRRRALDDAWRTVRLSWRERRAYLAVAVAVRLVSADRLMTMAHKRGQGI